MDWLSRVDLQAPVWALLALFVLPMALLAGRRMWSSKQALAGSLARLLLILAIAVAAAGIRLLLPADYLGVVFVLDRSASMSESAREDALAFVREAGEAMGGEDQAAIVVVGDGARVEREPTERLDLGAIEGAVSPHQTDLASGLRLAEALVPADRTRRIVVLSDGLETQGDAIAQAASAAPDVELWTVPFTRDQAQDVLLEALTAPDQVAEGAAFEVRVVARASQPTAGTLHLWRNDRLMGSLPVQLRGGRADVFALRQEADESGFLRYRATLEVDPAQDAVPQNNVAVATVAVQGRPRILYVEGKAGQAHHLESVLAAEGVAVDVVGPAGLPGSLASLQPYSAVLLSDVPAYGLTSRQMEVLRRYVRDLGRGFAMLGGDESFGVGGYYKTAIEEVLPVRMDIQDKRYFPSLAMALAIDKSGSMGGVGKAEKLGMAKEAAIQTSELMADRDRLGVISFDGAASWAVPMTTLSDRGRVQKAIAALRPGGGTNIYPALKEAYGALHRERTAQKHIVLLSDGVSMGADFESLIKMGARREITLTTIGFGEDTDRHSMAQWAQWGAGRTYLVTAPDQIPRIFTREAMLASRSFLIEEPFQPTLGAPSPATRGLGDVPLPQLRGYVATEAKPRSTVALWAREDENTPLLATWRHGLGRTAAWTSDVKSRWAGPWLGTEAYTRTFTQLVRWLAASEGGADVTASAELDRGVLEVTVDAYDEQGEFRNFLQGEARMIAPDLSVRSVPLQQVAPGRYVARAPADGDGSHLVGVFLQDEDGNAVGQATAEAAQPYSPEYRPGSGGEALLAEVARVGRGEEPDSPADVFRRPAVPRLVPHSLVPPLLLLAALLLLLDVALRRLEWHIAGRKKLAVAAIAPRLPPVPRPARPEPRRPPGKPVAAGQAPEPDLLIEPPPPEPTESDAYVGGLLAARKRARDRNK